MNLFRSSSHTAMWTIWMVASLFYAYQYILRVMPNIILNDIMDQFDMGAVVFGQFSGIYYIGYSLIHLPLGIMLDRYGPRNVMTACIFLTIIGLTPLLFADHWIYPVVGRFLMGLGSSAAILGVFKIIRMTFSEKRFPRMLSFSVTIGLMGAIYGGGPVSYMRDLFGYQTVVQMFIGLGVVLMGITYWIVPQVKSVSETTVFSNIKEVLSNKRVIWACVSAGLMVGPLEGFADVWGTAFLNQVYGFNGTIVASLPSMIFVGMCFGAPLLSLLAEKVGSYLLTVIGSGIVMLVSFVLLLMFPIPAALMSLSFVLVGVCCAYQILAIYKTSTYVREGVSGLATAVANMIIMIFGYAFHSVIGWVINMMGGPFQAQALLYGIAVIPIGLFLGTSGFFMLFNKSRLKVLDRSL